MVTKPILGCDVDLCVCPSDEGWIQYLQYHNGFGDEVEIVGELPYNLSELFPSVADPLHYWRTLDYSQFSPIQGSVEALEKLSEHFDIFFISQHKGMHSKTKYYWLDEWFPFKSGVMLTKEKWGMNGSVVAMIDDRMSQLKGFDKEKRILFNTPYTQDVQCEVEMSFGVWDDEVVNKICSRYL